MEHWRFTRHHSQKRANLPLYYLTGCWAGERLPAACRNHTEPQPALRFPGPKASNHGSHSHAEGWLLNVEFVANVAVRLRAQGSVAALAVASYQSTHLWSQFTDASIPQPPGMLCPFKGARRFRETHYPYLDWFAPEKANIWLYLSLLIITIVTAYTEFLPINHCPKIIPA